MIIIGILIFFSFFGNVEKDFVSFKMKRMFETFEQRSTLMGEVEKYFFLLNKRCDEVNAVIDE